MKRFILIAFGLCFAIVGKATQLTVSEAVGIASSFYAQRLVIHQQSGRAVAITGITEVEVEGRVVAYAVNMEAGGFVLVSASEHTLPVLGYSLKGSYETGSAPDAVKAWFRYYGRQLKTADERGETDPWVTSGREALMSSSRNNGPWRLVEPMLVTTWDQGVPYNAQCPAHPDGPGGHCYAGCVATTVGQLMFYHRWPESGSGSYSYTHPVFGELSANFGEAEYDWNQMETSLQRNNVEVGELLYHLGVSFDMDYGPNSSGMWNHSAANSMRTFFKYGPETQYVFRDETTMDWDSIIVANLEARKPLYYAGWEGVGSQNGHAFVCDGYAPDGFYHFNWGWSGQMDGYFLLSALTPGGNNFNFAQELIRDIYPDTTLYNYPPYCQGSDTLTGIRGTFSDGSNSSNYMPNADCYWLIDPDTVAYDSIVQLTLSFPQMELDESDQIFIYQGKDTTATLIGTFSGSNIPEQVVVEGRNCLVRFISDGTVEDNGLLISYNAMLPSYCSGTTVYTDLSGAFDDGSGNKNYGNNALCKYKITPADPEPITLVFDEFSTEAGRDVLNIYDLGTQQLIASLSGDSIPEPITVQSGKVYLIFVTDDDIVGSGWKVRWAPEGTIDAGSVPLIGTAISPNPAGNWLNVTSPESADFSLYSLTGKCLLSQKVKASGGTGESVSLSGVPPGLYIVVIQTAGSRQVFKLVKL